MTIIVLSYTKRETGGASAYFGSNSHFGLKRFRRRVGTSARTTKTVLSGGCRALVPTLQIPPLTWWATARIKFLGKEGDFPGARQAHPTTFDLAFSSILEPYIERG